ncbi:MAG: glycosyltransferase family 4 protein [Pseudomonadota bacterium]
MILISAQAFPPASGGIQNLMQGLAEYASQRHEVVVLADGGREAGPFDSAAPYRVERFSGPRPLRRWLKARRLAELVRSGQVRAVYADSWKSVEALRPLRVPVVAYGHGNEFPSDPRKQARVRAALSKATALICVSRETHGRAAPSLPEGLPVEIIHPPVFPHTPASAEDVAYAEGIWDAGPRLLTMSRLIDWKGIDQAIRTVGRLGSPDARLAIAGIGDDRARLERLVTELGLAAQVRFLGRVEGGRKTALLETADVFLQPGRQVGQEREGFGITYVEAALAGTPVISGNKGGAPEAVADGVSGLLVDGDDLDAIVTATRTVLQSPEGWRDGARAHGERHLWSVQIEHILGVAGL